MLMEVEGMGCQWQDTDSNNNTGPVGVRVQGTLRGDVLLPVGQASERVQ